MESEAKKHLYLTLTSKQSINAGCFIGASPGKDNLFLSEEGWIEETVYTVRFHTPYFSVPIVASDTVSKTSHPLHSSKRLLPWGSHQFPLTLRLIFLLVQRK